MKNLEPKKEENKWRWKHRAIMASKEKCFTSSLHSSISPTCQFACTFYVKFISFSYHATLILNPNWISILLKSYNEQKAWGSLKRIVQKLNYKLLKKITRLRFLMFEQVLWNFPTDVFLWTFLTLLGYAIKNEAPYEKHQIV